MLNEKTRGCAILIPNISDNETRIKYGKVCLCTGAQPKLISDDNPFVIGIRDTASVIRLQVCQFFLKGCLLVVNEGIGSKLGLYTITNDVLM